MSDKVNQIIDDMEKAMLQEVTEFNLWAERLFALQRKLHDVEVGELKAQIAEKDKKIKSIEKYHMTNEFVPIERCRALEAKLAEHQRVVGEMKNMLIKARDCAQFKEGRLTREHLIVDINIALAAAEALEKGDKEDGG